MNLDEFDQHNMNNSDLYNFYFLFVYLYFYIDPKCKVVRLPPAKPNGFNRINFVCICISIGISISYFHFVFCILALIV